MKKRHILLVLKLLVVVIIFYFLGRQTILNWEKAKNFNWQPNLFYLLLSALVMFALNFARGWTWGLILRLVDHTITFKKSVWVWIVSSYGRYIPGKIWLFLGKVYLSMQEGVTRKNACMSDSAGGRRLSVVYA